MSGDKFLEVTRQPNALNIEPQGTAVVTYVVTNRTGRDDHVRVKLPDDNGAAPFALKLRESAEQHVSNGGTATFNLEIAAGPGATPGSCDVKLEFIASLMEDQAFAASAVAVTIPPPKAAPEKPAGKPFPWALVLSLCGAVMLGAGLWIGIAVTSAQKTGEKCGDASDCRNGHLCAAPSAEAPTADNKVCLKDTRQACGANDECATGYCRTTQPAAEGAAPSGAVASGGASSGEAASGEAASGAGECRPRATAGGACETPTDCASPASCTSGKCVLAAGSACETDAACETGLCGPTAPPTGQAAGPAPKLCLDLPTVMQACTADNRCGQGFTCTRMGKGSVCLFALGSACAGDAACESGFCSKEHCVARPAVGGPCINGQCGLGMSCESGRGCLKSGGFECGGDNECVSGRCTERSCGSLGQLFDACTSAQQCAGLICASGRCLRPLDTGCTADAECGTGVCFGRQCQKPHAAGERCEANAHCAGGLSCDDHTCVRGKLPIGLALGLSQEAMLQRFQPMRMNLNLK